MRKGTASEIDASMGHTSRQKSNVKGRIFIDPATGNSPEPASGQRDCHSNDAHGIVKLVVLVAVPPLVVREILPVVAPAGTVAEI